MCSQFHSRIALTTLTIAALISAAPTRAQNADPPRRERDPDLQLGTYEVGDLVVTVPDYVAPQGDSDDFNFSSRPQGGFGGGGGGFGGGETSTGGRVGDQPVNFDASPYTLPALEHVITNVIHPDSWEINGRGEGAIESIGSALVVLNTNEVHELIHGLLEELRRGSGARQNVTVDARWLLLNSDDLDSLIRQGDDPADEPVVDRKVLAEFTRRPTSLRGLTNCFSGQGVYLISGTRRNVVRSYIPVVGSVEPPSDAGNLVAYTVAIDDDRAPLQVAQFGGGSGGYDGGGRSVGYQPVIETPNFGVLLKIRPTRMHGEEAAVVDLTSTITFPGLGSNAAMEAPAPGAAPSVDRLAIDTQELATTMRVPLGKPVLVGGMSYISPNRNDAPPADPTAARGEAPQETRQLYLVLEVR